MKVYLLSPHCLPTRNPRTLRIENVRKILSLKWKVKVLCSKFTKNISVNKDVTNSRTDNEIYKLKIEIFNKPSFFSKFIKKIIFPDIYIMHNIWVTIKYLIFYSNRENVLITFSNPFSTHIAGIISKIFWPKRKWICDIGDLYQHNPNQKLPKWISPLLNWFERLVLNKSDYVILNSNEIFKFYKSNFDLDPSKTRIIYNGSILDFRGLDPTISKNTIMSFIGNTYEKVREGRLELQLILDTINSYSLKNNNFRIILAGKQDKSLYAAFKNKAEVDFMSTLQEHKLIELYQKTNILINFANHNYQGLPSKLYEYRLTGLPIIHFTYGPPDPSIEFLSDYPKILIYHLELDKSEKLINFILKYKHASLSPIPNIDYNPEEKWNSLINSLQDN
ncbi:MAG TPA: glycosyltransferase [Saprospiraceae bacterium]|nr:glycosyltransferase [Saprospiraceae bacterium]